MRSDREAMGFVPEPLDEIQGGVTFVQLEGLPPRREEGFAAGIALRAFGDADQRNAIGHRARPERHGNPEFRHDVAHGIELALAAVDQKEIGPGGAIVEIRRAGGIVAHVGVLGTGVRYREVRRLGRDVGLH